MGRPLRMTSSTPPSSESFRPGKKKAHQEESRHPSGRRGFLCHFGLARPIDERRSPGPANRRSPPVDYFTASLSALSGRIFTSLRAGLALKIVGSLVKGVIPFRALVAAFFTTFILASPGSVKPPCLAMSTATRAASAPSTFPTCLRGRPVADETASSTPDLVPGAAALGNEELSSAKRSSFDVQGRPIVPCCAPGRGPQPLLSPAK